MTSHDRFAGDYSLAIECRNSAYRFFFTYKISYVKIKDDLRCYEKDSKINVYLSHNKEKFGLVFSVDSSPFKGPLVPVVRFEGNRVVQIRRVAIKIPDEPAVQNNTGISGDWELIAKSSTCNGQVGPQGIYPIRANINLNHDKVYLNGDLGNFDVYVEEGTVKILKRRKASLVGFSPTQVCINNFFRGTIKLQQVGEQIKFIKKDNILVWKRYRRSTPFVGDVFAKNKTS